MTYQTTETGDAPLAPFLLAAFMGWKADALAQACYARGLPCTGSKRTLAERLHAVGVAPSRVGDRTPAHTPTCHYKVRKTTSGYNGVTKYLVVKNPGGKRVTVHAHITLESAQAEADDLNIGAMVRDHADDPRPYAVRRAEAEAAYRRISSPPNVRT